jgi:hypothetical protein
MRQSSGADRLLTKHDHREDAISPTTRFSKKDVGRLFSKTPENPSRLKRAAMLPL